MEHAELVRQRGLDETTEPLPPEVDAAAAGALGDFYGFACSVLEQLRADEVDGEPSKVVLWPEHFDIAIDLGPESADKRATIGASPGDESHPEPYLYVTPWAAEVSSELWNAQGFKGAELGYAELLAAPDQRRRALDFLRERMGPCRRRR